MSILEQTKNKLKNIFNKKGPEATGFAGSGNPSQVIVSEPVGTDNIGTVENKSDNALKDCLETAVLKFRYFWSVATNHRVNKRIYFLLALLFGAMGVHRFYARHYLSGILYLSFFFVGFLFLFVYKIGMLVIIPLELLALVQGIWILFKRPGVDGKVEV